MCLSALGYSGVILLYGKHVEKAHIVILEISEDNIETNLPVDVAHILGEPRISGVLFFFCFFLLFHVDVNIVNRWIDLVDS